MSARGINYGNDERLPPTSPQGYSEFAFNGVQRINKLLSRQPEAYTIELEEKLLVTENALHEAENKVELLGQTVDIQTDRIERLETAVRALAPYEQFFHTITTLLHLPAFASTPAPNGDTNV